MTLIRPPAFRSAIPFHYLQGGEVVGAGEWNRIAGEVNYAARSGRVIVPSFKPDIVLDTGDGDTEWTFSLWLEPAYQAIEYVTSATYRVNTSGTNLIRANRSGTLDVSSPKIQTRTEKGSQSTTGAAVDLTIAIKGTQEAGRAWVDGIQVVELPRGRLEDDVDERGIDPGYFVSGQPIAWARGVQQIREAVERDDQIGRRVLLHYAEPYATDRQGSNATEAGAGGDIITSGSFVTVRGGSGVPVLARREFTSSVARIVKARAFARCSNSGTAGEVRFVSSANGASSAITFLGGLTTSFAWSDPVDLVIDCEDGGDPQGLNGGTWDMLTVEARRTLGTGNLFVAGWVVYEEGP
jgi:hypothetical protein